MIPTAFLQRNFYNRNVREAGFRSAETMEEFAATQEDSNGNGIRLLLRAGRPRRIHNPQQLAQARYFTRTAVDFKTKLGERPH